MKKFTLLAAAFAVSFGINAQIFSDDFNDGDITNWTQLDVDGDGNVFFPYNPTGAASPMVASASWTGASGALTPNNYLVSPAIDITGLTGLELTYEVGGQDPDFFAENYTVYVSTGFTVADFMDPAKTVSFTENLGNDVNAAGALVSRSLDVTALDGETTVYIALRHHNVTDQFVIIFDNIVLDNTLSVVDSKINGFSYYYSPQSKNLTMSANHVFSSINIFNILGQEVVTKKLSASTEVINLSSLKNGVYIAKVLANGQSTTFRLIKR